LFSNFCTDINPITGRITRLVRPSRTYGLPTPEQKGQKTQDYRVKVFHGRSNRRACKCPLLKVKNQGYGCAALSGRPHNMSALGRQLSFEPCDAFCEETVSEDKNRFKRTRTFICCSTLVTLRDEVFQDTGCVQARVCVGLSSRCATNYTLYKRTACGLCWPTGTRATFCPCRALTFTSTR